MQTEYGGDRLGWRSDVTDGESDLCSAEILAVRKGGRIACPGRRSHEDLRQMQQLFAFDPYERQIFHSKS
jgi:hypothetical protein